MARTTFRTSYGILFPFERFGNGVKPGKIVMSRIIVQVHLPPDRKPRVGESLVCASESENKERSCFNPILYVRDVARCL